MSRLFDVAADHQARRIEVARRASVAAVELWRRGDVAQLDASWAALAPEMVSVVAAAQVTAARQSAPYLNKVTSVLDAPTEAARLIPEVFSGVMADGRELGPAMFGAVTTTKRAIGAGLSPFRAFQAGASFLAVVVGSAVNDMGRSADGTLAAGKGYTRYVRVVNPGACSRCAILAGASSYKVAFQRHPKCRCTACPLPDGGKVPAGFHDSPDAYFGSLSPAEQDRVFTKAGAESIRHGANPIKVVNARRGALSVVTPDAPRRLVAKQIGWKPDGTPLNVFLTGEGTSARGAFGARELSLTQDAEKIGRYRRTTSVRLMPEGIMKMAGDNPERMRELLRKYDYLY